MPLRSAALAATLITTAHAGAVSLPAEFESASDQIVPISAFFGGVGGINIALSSHMVFAGQSQAVEVLWQPDPVFSTAGAVVGDTLIPASDLNNPSDATFFSIAIDAPLEGVFTIQIVLGEDDDADGAIDPVGDDDEWTSPRIFLDPGLHIYNLNLADFTDTSEGGDGVQNFDTTTAMSLRMTFETRASYPGGMVESPATYFIDHAGLFTEPQTLGDTNPADLNADGVVDSDDLAILIAAWGTAAADLDNDGNTDSSDLAILLAAWG